MLWPGAYLGGAIVPWTSLWVARIAKLHRKVSKIEAWPPPPPLCKMGIRFDHTNGRFCASILGFVLEIGLNLSEELFFFLALHLILGEKPDKLWVKTFFCSSPDFGRKTGRILNEDLFFFFALHLNLGESSDEFWVKTFFALHLILGESSD